MASSKKNHNDILKVMRIIKAAKGFFDRYEIIEAGLLEWDTFGKLEEFLPDDCKSRGFLGDEYQELNDSLEAARLSLCRSDLGLRSSEIIHDIKSFAHEIRCEKTLVAFETNLYGREDIPKELHIFNTRDIFRLERMGNAAVLDAHIKDLINGSKILKETLSNYDEYITPTNPEQESEPVDNALHEPVPKDNQSDESDVSDSIKKITELFEKGGFDKDKEAFLALLSMPGNEQVYVLRFQLFRLAQTYYSLVESVATGLVNWMDYELNHYYDMVVKGIRVFLDMPEFKDLSLEFNPPANLFPDDELDVIWDCGLKQRIQDFVGQTQSYLNEINRLEIWNSDNVKKTVSYIDSTVEKSLKAASQHSQRAEKTFNTMVDKVKIENARTDIKDQTKPITDKNKPNRRGKGVLEEHIKPLIKTDPTITNEKIAELLNERWAKKYTPTSESSVGKTRRKLKQNEG